VAALKYMKAPFLELGARKGAFMYFSSRGDGLSHPSGQFGRQLELLDGHVTVRGFFPGLGRVLSVGADILRPDGGIAPQIRVADGAHR